MRWRLPVRAAVAAACCVCAVAAACCACAVAGPAAVADARAAPNTLGAPPNVSARAAILIDADTGQRVYGLAPDRELPIASTTKLMTALVTLEHVPQLGRVFVQNDYQPESVDSQIGLVPGERMTVRDLLVALLLPSADDAAEDLAFNVGGGSVTRFVAMMNTRASELGLSHTHYSTPSGLDTPGNYSTAADLVKLARFLLLHHPFFAQTVARQSAVVHVDGQRRLLTNRNDLVGQIPWVSGVKTGHTLGAGYVLVGAGRRRGMTLLSVVLGTSSEQSRDSSTLDLLDYGLSNFQLSTPVRKGSVLARPAVKYRSGMRASLLAASTFKRVVPRNAMLSTRVQAPRELTGPLRRGAVIGRVVVFADGRPVARIPLRLARALPGVSPLTVAARFLTRPITLLSLVALLCGAIAAALFRRERARERKSPGLEAA